ncbi:MULTISPECIES: 3'-5' exonuclease [unclassified Pseudoalteromonas]|uniref:3'-5' exonuclease n=1 Tax=unclassified Pseudoalteromonas TaxID=194690 RepID=UPI0020979D9E|nr:3'-5' exonuclease [Pseudoalteromonas sp. XMcav2-N]MCO7188483.1 3'-5' exonuclease [Pseudoalteromonas sp. XMcav2-N]
MAVQGDILSWPNRFAHLARQSNDERLRAFYNAGVQAPETPVSQARFVALDFETTGLDHETDDIVSVGLVPFDARRIYCRDAKHWIIKPATPLHTESVVVHQITHSQVSDAPDLEDILEELLACLAGRVIVVHYRHIERLFFNQTLMQRLGEGIEFPLIDTMMIEHQVETARQTFWQRFTRQPISSIRLADSRKRYGLPYYIAHHALSDALATAELLQAQLQHHYTQNTEIKSLWV